MKPVDSHSHLDFDRFNEDRKQVIERAEEELEFVAVAGCDPERNRAVKDLCKGSEFLIPNYGLHPTFTDSFDSLDEVERQIREWSPAGIGEIGLDHHHVTDEETRERQREIFESMLELAEELGKPVVVHSRKAEQECVETVENYDLNAFFHCFNGSVDLGERAVEDGNFVGITTQVLYSSGVQEIAEALPLESLVLETDSPFLYPDGRNEPVHAKESAEKIAELKDVELSEVIERTTSNSRSLFDR